MWPFKKKQVPDYSYFKAELHTLCKEWFDNQIGHLPKDELPPQEEIDQDVLGMRDEIFRKMLPQIESSNAIRNGGPDDEANLYALETLIEQFRGHGATTPIFTKLALSKADKSEYGSGWPLCVVRIVAESYLGQSTGA